jgi:pyruvate formate lyase activating enzyme
MLVSGIQQCTLLDYPERTACIIFTPGCNFRCGYCHNSEFVLPEKIKEIRDTFIDEDVVFQFLDRRRGKLDGVVVSGGEPTLMPDLADFFTKIKARGFLAKLDTNGNRPDVLGQLIDERLVDYVAMDIKTALPAYAKLVGNRAVPERIRESIDILKRSDIEHEFRATLIREIHTKAILKEMSESLRGTRQLFLQTFRPEHTLNPLFGSFHPFSDAEMQSIVGIFRKGVDMVRVR